MNMSLEYLIEPFLIQYYLTDAVCGSFLSEQERSKMFFEMADIFCIDDKKILEEYYKESQMEYFKTIVDYASYERLCRTIEFAEKSNQAVSLSETDRMILAQKREAMAIKAELFRQGKNLTKETISASLLATSTNGSIDAMCLLSYMEYHGICIFEDKVDAVKRMRLCAKWNNLFGNLMGIKYDPEHLDTYYDTLYTIFRNAGQKQVFAHICESGRYMAECSKNPVARIIEKAFGLGIIKRNVYDTVFAKVAFSSLISAEDKEKILLNKKKDAIASLSDFPFDAKERGSFVFCEDALDNLPLMRSAEIRRIKQNLSVARDCPENVYIPLLVVSSDEYIISMYYDAVKRGFADMSLIEVDGGTLTARDFCQGKENVFLRGLSETKTTKTVFLIKDCEELSEDCAKEFAKILDYEYRRRFKLFEPSVSVDLSDILFVLFANENNKSVRSISYLCDVLPTERVKREEKADMIDCVFLARSRSYGKTAISLGNDCIGYLSDYDSDKIVKILDAVIRNAIFEKSERIDVDQIKAVCKEQNIVQGQAGFGYTGGKYHD